MQGGRRYHFSGKAIPLGYCAWEKLHLPVLRTVVEKVIPESDVMDFLGVFFFVDRIVWGGTAS